MINRPVIMLEGSIASETQQMGEGFTRRNASKKKTRAGQLLRTHIAQEGNHRSGPDNTGEYVSKIQNTIKNAQHGVINVTRDRGREP